MSDMVDLLREVQTRQRVIDEQESGESVEDFDRRVRERHAMEDEWIGTLYYKGNSVSWSHSKAERYKEDLERVWEALTALGVPCDGNTHAAAAIRKFLVLKRT